MKKGFLLVKMCKLSGLHDKSRQVSQCAFPCSKITNEQSHSAFYIILLCYIPEKHAAKQNQQLGDLHLGREGRGPQQLISQLGKIGIISHMVVICSGVGGYEKMNTQQPENTGSRYLCSQDPAKSHGCHVLLSSLSTGLSIPVTKLRGKAAPWHPRLKTVPEEMKCRGGGHSWPELSRAPRALRTSSPLAQSSCKNVFLWRLSFKIYIANPFQIYF